MGKSNSYGATERKLIRSAGLAGVLFAGLSGCAAFESASLDRSEWRASEIAGVEVGGKAQSTLVFHDGGQINGNGACNQMFGRYEASGHDLRFESVGSTKMACVPAVMKQETRFFDALAATRHFSQDDEGRLLLEDESGSVIAKLDRTDTLKVSSDYWRPMPMLLLR